MIIYKLANLLCLCRTGEGYFYPLTSGDQVIINDNQKLGNLFDLIYPVGSIYMSINSIDPTNLFGGVWEQIKDQFLLSAGDTYTAGATGGSATHTLTVDEIPSHSHRLKRNGDFTNAVMVDTGRKGQWGSAIAQVGSIDYTAQPNDITVENTGGGKAHNNMPPYYAVYMWQRIG